MLKILAACFGLLLLCPMLASAQADPFSGIFQNDEMTLSLSKAPDGYSGTIQMGDNSFPAKATVVNKRLNGKFTSEGKSFTFTAEFTGETLNFKTGKTGYSLTKNNAPSGVNVPDIADN